MPVEFTVYKIVHRVHNGSEKIYVGITIRTLKARLAAHIAEKARKKGVAKGSLGEAIRIAFSNGLAEREFEIIGLQKCESIDDLRQAEADWIARLHSQAPKGYNIMRGGSSAGSLSNAKQVTVSTEGQSITFASFAEACRVFCEDLDNDRFYFRACRRREAGWTVEQALGLETHQDGRLTALSQQAKDKGVLLDTLRSRAYRQRTKSEPFKYRLPNPKSPDGDRIDAECFAKLTRIPVSTVRYRAKRIGSARLASLTNSEVISFLKQSVERRDVIKVTVDGVEHECSRRKLAEKFNKGAHEHGTYSPHTIRKKLGLLNSDRGNDSILQALGLLDNKRPSVNLSTVPPVPRKVFCSDWTLTCNGVSREFANQANFCRASMEAIIQHNLTPTVPKKLNCKDHNEGSKQLQRWVSKGTQDGRSPTELAQTIGVLELLCPSAAS